MTTASMWSVYWNPLVNVNRHISPLPQAVRLTQEAVFCQQYYYFCHARIGSPMTAACQEAASMPVSGERLQMGWTSSSRCAEKYRLNGCKACPFPGSCRILPASIKKYTVIRNSSILVEANTTRYDAAAYMHAEDDNGKTSGSLQIGETGVSPLK